MFRIRRIRDLSVGLRGKGATGHSGRSIFRFVRRCVTGTKSGYQSATKSAESIEKR